MVRLGQKSSQIKEVVSRGVGGTSILKPYKYALPKSMYSVWRSSDWMTLDPFSAIRSSRYIDLDNNRCYISSYPTYIGHDLPFASTPGESPLEVRKMPYFGWKVVVKSFPMVYDTPMLLNIVVSYTVGKLLKRTFQWSEVRICVFEYLLPASLLLPMLLWNIGHVLKAGHSARGSLCTLPTFCSPKDPRFFLQRSTISPIQNIREETLCNWNGRE